MKNWLKLTLVIGAVTVLAFGLMAFRPWGGDSDEDGISDYTETLAEVLGISVEDLQAAQQSAKEAAVAQAVADGTITQEQADAILAGEGPTDAGGSFGGRGGKGEGGRFAFGGEDYSAFLADALGISTDELEAAEQEANQILMAQALEDGTITQEEYDMMLARTGVQPYMEDAFQQAYQDAVDAALADGAITADQAQLLLDNMPVAGFGAGGFDGGMRMPHGHGGPGGTEGAETETIQP